MLSFPPLPGIRLPKKSPIFPTVFPIEFVSESILETVDTLPVSRFVVSFGSLVEEVVVFFRPEQEDRTRTSPNAAIHAQPHLLRKKRGCFRM